MIERIYYRNEAGIITTTGAADWTPRTYLDAYPHLEYADTEALTGWPDSLVDWYAIGGSECGTLAAVGFPVSEPGRFVEHIQHQRKRAGLSPVQQGAWRGLSIFTLTEMVQRLTTARTEAQATLASAVDADHAAMLADSDTGADQDWQGEQTAWTFADGSVLTISGPVAEAEAGEALQ